MKFRHLIINCGVLESIHYNLVRKIRQHIGGQFLHQTNLRKSAGHTQQGSSLTLHKSLVVRARCEDAKPEHQYVASFFELSYNKWTLVAQLSRVSD